MAEASLHWLKAQRPEWASIVDTLIRHNKATKLRQFLTKLPQFVYDGRLHGSFGPDTVTGRLASRLPNLQNIPSGDKYGIRKAFVAPPGKRLLVADYSQLEPRILAHYLIELYGDNSLRDAIYTGDIYTAIAIRCWPHLELLPDGRHPLRSQAKAILLGTNYGKTVAGLALQLSLPLEEAHQLYDDYFDAYPGIAEFQSWAVQYAQKHGGVRTLFGRFRALPDAKYANDERLEARAHRQAINSIIQGSAADLVMQAMINAPELLVLQVHDELVWEVPESTDDSVFRKSMLDVDLQVELDVSVHNVARWAEAK